jgi:hypothetical protein
VETTATPRDLSGKVYLSVVATNREDIPLDIALSTPYGTKSFTAVAPGRSASASFNSRAVEIPAGEVSVAAIGAVDGQSVSHAKTIAFEGFAR